jgi:hypothetical protein
MTLRLAVGGIFVVLGTLVAATTAPAPDLTPLRTALTQQVTALTQANVGAVQGLDGWYFLRQDLAAYRLAQFGQNAPATTQPHNANDPLTVLVDFQQQLAKVNITLIVVPVPGKVVLYPDQLQPPLPALPVGVRMDAAYVQFYNQLAQSGVTVVDLYPEFARLRTAGIAPYCRQDSHWSPAAVETTAQTLADLIKAQPWYAAAPKVKTTTDQVAVTASGDLVTMLKATTPAECFTVRQVQIAERFADADDPASPQSPIILMGDSHCLVFGHEDLLAQHAGLASQLAVTTGIMPDVVAIMGGGINAPRITLARRKDNLAGKKCVIWVFAAHQLHESAEGWKKIPVIR